MYEGNPFYLVSNEKGSRLECHVEGWSYGLEIQLLAWDKKCQEQEEKIVAQKAEQAKRKKAWLEKQKV